jgi:hypothetical protein
LLDGDRQFLDERQITRRRDRHIVAVQCEATGPKRSRREGRLCRRSVRSLNDDELFIREFVGKHAVDVQYTFNKQHISIAPL